jgi:cytochrome c6
MNLLLIPLSVCFSVTILISNGNAEVNGKLDAKAAYDTHCASCHPAGGNIINKTKSLKKADLQKSGVKNWQDVVAKMRNPGPGMQPFSKQVISDKEAKALAEYILKTFK